MKNVTERNNSAQENIGSRALFFRGHRIIEDAFFVRDVFIPAAIQSQKWNIAVFEAYRVVELTIKGIMCLAGIFPIIENQSKYTHNIRKLINRFQSELRKPESHVSYFLALKSSTGNHYGIELMGNEAYLYKYIYDSWTQMQSALDISSLAVDGLVSLKLKFKNNTLFLLSNDTILTSQTDSSMSGDLRFEMGFQRAPDNKRIEQIIEIGELLLRNRTLAFYSEKTYSEEDALSSIANMENALEASKAFFASYQI